MIKLRLKELMDEEEITTKKLQIILNLSDDSKIYPWLNGVSLPKLKNLIKLADYFHCSIEYLLGRTEDNSQTKFKSCPAFDTQLKKIMEERKVTQYRIVYKDKILNSSHFHSWFKKKFVPEVETVVKLADYLNVSVDYLLGRE